MTDALFNLGPAEEPDRITRLGEQPIRADQVTAIREAFTAAGIGSLAERQEMAQSCVVRPLASLRELTAVEAHRLLKRIKDKANAKPRASGASPWDLREEDTWIDKL